MWVNTEVVVAGSTYAMLEILHITQTSDTFNVKCRQCNSVWNSWLVDSLVTSKKKKKPSVILVTMLENLACILIIVLAIWKILPTFLIRIAASTVKLGQSCFLCPGCPQLKHNCDGTNSPHTWLGRKQRLQAPQCFHDGFTHLIHSLQWTYVRPS